MTYNEFAQALDFEDVEINEDGLQVRRFAVSVHVEYSQRWPLVRLPDRVADASGYAAFVAEIKDHLTQALWGIMREQFGGFTRKDLESVYYYTVCGYKFDDVLQMVERRKQERGNA